MTFKRFPENDYRLTQNTYLEATKTSEITPIPELGAVPQTSLNYTAPSSIPPRKGKKVALVLLSGILCYGGYNLWNSYLRYDSFGVVESDIVGVHTTVPGSIQSLKVSEGSLVQTGDFLAQIVSTEDNRQLEKLNDEIKIALAELDAKKAEIMKDDLNRLDLIRQIEGQIADASAAIGELRAKMSFQRGEAARYARLKMMDAAGSQEVDSARSQANSAAYALRGKEASLKSLQDRLTSLKSQESDSAALKPIESKIAFLNNEKSRYTDKIKEGNIYSNYSGIVSSIKKRPGELVGADPILTLIIDGTANLVLYYDPSDKLPVIGSKVQVMIPSLGKMVDSEVISISKDVADPPDQIKNNYLANQKLVKVYLDPTGGYEPFVVGSVIKRPNPTDIIKDALNLVSLTVSESYAK
jgi:multidrug resistance efflux pump